MMKWIPVASTAALATTYTTSTVPECAVGLTEMSLVFDAKLDRCNAWTIRPFPYRHLQAPAIIQHKQKFSSYVST